MKIDQNRKKFKFQDYSFELNRSVNGVMEIHTTDAKNFACALGFSHALDRGMQMQLTKIAGQGRLSECFKNTNKLFETDVYMRQMGFHRQAKVESDEFCSSSKNPDVLQFAQSYVDGVNHYFKNHTRPLEFFLVSFNPSSKNELWKLEDIFLIIKIMSYMGLAQAQYEIEKFIVQAIQSDVSIDKLKDMFTPHLDELDEELLALIKKVKLVKPTIPLGVEFLGTIPKIMASNNWAIGKNKTKENRPIHCHDPHLECNRLPAIWYEYIGHIGEEKVIGISMPGVPGVIMGRNKKVSFGFTYGFMDMIDLFIEEVRDGKSLRDGKEVPINFREELIKRKGKRPITIHVPETDIGILETDPGSEIKNGLYFTRAWSAQNHGAGGSLVALYKLQFAASAFSAQEIVKEVSISSNWILTDVDGNLAFQQAGLLPKRKNSGLYPLDARNSDNLWEEILSSDSLISYKNPAENYIVSANNDMSEEGKPVSVNLSMGPYRYDRIKELLESQNDFNLDDMKFIQTDLLSLQAKKFGHIFEEVLGPKERGPITDLLKNWDYRYIKYSKEATVFEEFYSLFLEEVFGKNYFGMDVWDYLSSKTSLLADYFYYFDRIIFDESKQNDPTIYSGMTRNELMKVVLKRVVDKFNNDPSTIPQYGESHSFTMKNIFFDGSLPSFFNVDYGPIPIEGSRATIVQGNIYKAHGEETSFCPSWRFISTMDKNNGDYFCMTALAGGVSDRPKSPYYLSDVELWLDKTFKTLK
jgi:penicillin G amidase